jgi:5-methyltetrahydrofolate--homocysteine methyltransferase
MNHTGKLTIIGELINTSRAAVNRAVASRDRDYISGLAREQERYGAAYIDLNAGARVDTEKEDLLWLIEVVEATVKAPVCLDSPKAEVLRAGLERVTRAPLVNSISLESNRYGPMLDFLKGSGCRIIALCMADEGLPSGSGPVVDRAVRLVDGLSGAGFAPQDILVDPLAQPVSINTRNALSAMAALVAVRETLPEVGTVCGLSNISYGLPQRRAVNRVFLSLMISRGLEAAILDPLDRELRTVLAAATMLLDRDEYCLEFMAAAAAGDIGDCLARDGGGSLKSAGV